jgi:hypothetical protein
MGNEKLWRTRRASVYKGADPGRPNWKSRLIVASVDFYSDGVRVGVLLAPMELRTTPVSHSARDNGFAGVASRTIGN